MASLKKQKCSTVLKHDFIQDNPSLSFKHAFGKQWVTVLPLVRKIFKMTLRVVGAADLELTEPPVFSTDLF